MSAPPKSRGNLMRTCPGLRLRQDLCAKPLRRFDAAFHYFESVDSCCFNLNEAQFHGLLTRCLRFVAWVAPSYARLASDCWLALSGGSRLILNRLPTCFRACSTCIPARLLNKVSIYVFTSISSLSWFILAHQKIGFQETAPPALHEN